MGNSIGERIRQYRIINNLSQENVAEELNMSNGNYGKIERGEIDVSSTHLMTLAKIFKINVGDFFEPIKLTLTAEPEKKIGYVTKMDFIELSELVKKLASEIEKISRKNPLEKSKAVYTIKKKTRRK
jgi:transcriptional regulator with XRE-family HTH domain